MNAGLLLGSLLRELTLTARRAARDGDFHPCWIAADLAHNLPDLIALPDEQIAAGLRSWAERDLGTHRLRNGPSAQEQLLIGRLHTLLLP